MLDLFRRLFISRSDVYALRAAGESQYHPIRRELTDRVLNLHLRGSGSVGSYLLRQDLARVLIFDLDVDDQSRVEKIATQLKVLVPRNSVVIERTGGRGWHIWLLLNEWISASRLLVFAKQVLRDADAGDDWEIYPKAASTGVEGLGTLVRLPLGKHWRTQQPSTLYTIDLEPAELSAFSLASANFLPEAVDEAPPQTERAPAVGKIHRGWPCIQSIERGVDEGERDSAMFALACHYRDQGRDAELSLVSLRKVNQRNRPPLKDSVLAIKIKSAYGSTAQIGCQTEILAKHCSPAECRYRGRRLARRSWDMTRLLDAKIPPIHWIVEGMLPQGFGLLAGKPKIGKSWLALALALAVASGSDFLGHHTHQHPVLFLALEDGEGRIQKRLEFLGAQRGSPLQFEFEFPRFGSGGIDALKNLLYAKHEQGEYGLIILDSLSAAKSTRKEELSVEDMEQVLRPLQSLGQSLGCHVLAIHHHRKSATGDVIWDARGSGAMAAIADVSIGIYQEESGPRFRFMTRSRDAAELDYWIDFQDGRWLLLGDSREMGTTDTASQILAIIKSFGGITSKQLSEIQAVSQRTASRQLAALAKRGSLVRKGNVYELVVDDSGQAVLDFDI